MTGLRMQLFGRPAIRRADSTVVAIPTSVQPLLGYLALEPAAHCHRDRVVETLWPGLPSSVGSRRLNTVVWRARTLFGGERDEVLHVTRAGAILLDAARIEIDVQDAVVGLRQAIRSTAPHDALRTGLLAGSDTVNRVSTADTAADALARAARIDAEEFLLGCYDEWVVRARDELASSVVALLERLAAEADDSAAAIGWCELLLRWDPLREDVHRRLIRLYAEAGRRADALHQYDVCCRHLKEDLGVEPLVETSLLAAAVRENVPPLSAQVADSAEALRQLRGALASCRNAVEQIERALTALPGA